MKPLQFSPDLIRQLRRVSPDTRAGAIVSGRKVRQRDERVLLKCADMWGEWAGERCARMAMEDVRNG